MRNLRRYVPAVLAMAASVALKADPTDLSAEAETAKSNFMSVFKTGLTAATVVTVVLGLTWTAWKFKQQDPHAVYWLVGTIVSSVVLGIAAAIVG